MRDEEETHEFVRFGELEGDKLGALPLWQPPPPVILVNALPLPMHTAPFETVDLELVTLPVHTVEPVAEVPSPSRITGVVTTILFLVCCAAVGISAVLLAYR